MAEAIEPIALSPGAAARYVGVSKRTIYNLIASGTLVARKFKGRTLVEVASLKSFLAGLPTKQTTEPLFPR
jgi:excisionase family DNA binding protein